MFKLSGPSVTKLHEQGHTCLISTIAKADREGVLCPPAEHIFDAFLLCNLPDTKVVILGQDPYHTEGKANGLAFGLHADYHGGPQGSLLNIEKELYSDLGVYLKDYSLKYLAKQGVLLLNTSLTTEKGIANAHAGLGWEEVIAEQLQELSKYVQNSVYILWGNHAQKYAQYIDHRNNLILEGAHPSPLSASRGFFGGRYFSAANEYLKYHGRGEIQWGE